MILYKYIFLQFLKSISIILMLLSVVEASNVKNSATVFMYHKFGVAKYPSTSVTIKQLEDHINELSKQKYNILPINFILDPELFKNVIKSITSGSMEIFLII